MNDISLRDYFAAQALAAIIEAKSKNDASVSIICYNNGSSIDRSQIARTAYQYADAMLNVR